LKRVVADKTLEVDFFKGALQKIEARRSSASNLVVGVGQVEQGALPVPATMSPQADTFWEEP